MRSRNFASYLSVEEVAQRFRVNSTTIYRLAQRGILPGFKVGSQWRFSPTILDSWVAQQMKPTH
ncbi:MAG: helix-turn-helix domain-containing protein [Candidatus Omnitrophica bacterium]|nr:helix-turn-helix domain-containing protein [Candidatus Omnitrophota bacterium]